MDAFLVNELQNLFISPLFPTHGLYLSQDPIYDLTWHLGHFPLVLKMISSFGW